MKLDMKNRPIKDLWNFFKSRIYPGRLDSDFSDLLDELLHITRTKIFRKNIENCLIFCVAKIYRYLKIENLPMTSVCVNLINSPTEFL